MATDEVIDTNATPPVIPGFVQAAGIHSMSSNRDGGILDSVANAPKFWGLALGSGVTSIANSFIEVSNLFADKDNKTQQVNFGKWIAEYDSDWGKYYRDNADSIDLWGFVGTSIIPGSAGIKALNLGQKALTVAASKGVHGKGMQWATNLLVPRTETYINSAATELAKRASNFKFLQKETLQAVGTRFHQNALEAAAFETGVLAAMHQSPFFEDMEVKDIVTNAAMGIVLGGAIGGVLGIPGVRRQIKTKTEELRQPGNMAKTQDAIPSTAPEGAKLSLMYANKAMVEAFEAVPLGATDELKKVNLAAARDTKIAIENEIYKQVRTMTRGAETEGRYFADKLTKMDSNTMKGQTLGMDQFARVGNVPRQPVPPGSPRNLKTPPEEGWEFARLYGAGKGQILEQRNLPNALPLADAVSTSKAIGYAELRQTLDKIVSSHQHKLGDVAFHVAKRTVPLEKVQSRYMHGVTKGFKFNWKKPVTVFASDLPVLESLMGKIPEGGLVQILGKGGKPLIEISDNKNLQENIIAIKEKFKRDLIEEGASPEEIAERLNISPGYVTGMEVSNSLVDDLFYKQKIARDEGVELKDLFYQPQYLGFKTDPNRYMLRDSLLDELDMDAELALRSIQKKAQQDIDSGIAQAQSFFADSKDFNFILNELPEASVLDDVALKASSFGPGGGVFSFMNGNYLTPEAVMQHLGSQKGRADQVMFNYVEDKFSAARNILQTDNVVATEFNVISQQIARTRERYVLDGDVLKAQKIKQYEDALERGENPTVPKLQDGAREIIPLDSAELRLVVQTHMDLNAQKINATKALRAAQGRTYDLDPNVFYPPKPNPDKFKHFALVRDPTVSGSGHVTMIHAASKDQLEAMRNAINREFPEFQVLTRQHTKEYFEARGAYDRSMEISENHIDSMLASKGINSNFLPRTDGNLIADELMTWHKSQLQRLNSDIWSSKYERAFRELELRGREYSTLDSAAYDSMEALATSGQDNPYVDMIRTALNVSRVNQIPILTPVNKWLDDVVSGVWNRAQARLASARSPEELEEVNKIFDKHGFKTAYYTSELWNTANHPAGQQVLSKFVRAMNGVLATTFLRWDLLNAINNKLGSVVLTSSELRSLLNGIENANPEAAGRLAELAKVKVPGTNDMILSPQRLISRALSNFIKRPDLMEQYKTLGFVSDNLTAARGILDDMALTGNETSAKLQQIQRKVFDWAKKAGDFGEKWTGNKTVEELNRFLAADIARQIGEVAVDAGVATAREARVIQNTFVNRTQVNLNRAQRPLAFQGPVGMALGLFQSYQFNLMQQLFRYIQPGNQKTAAMLMGMQSSFYGLNAIPGLQEFNEYIIGQAAGNFEHKDIYDAVYQAAGPDAASWLMYGAPSNILQTNLYTRGDLTPQHPTILPTSPWDFPVVAKAGQFFGNLKNTVFGIAGGQGIWQSILTGLEHNSINRPLAGLGSVLRATTGDGQVYSTDRAGNMLSSNDLWSLTTLARLAGGRPIDEAVARDAMWRTSVYRASDAQKRKDLGVKMIRAMSGDPDLDPYEFIDEYVQSGGKQSGFNKFVMNLQTRMTTSQAELTRQKLSDPYSQKMQTIMGGMDEAQFSMLR